MTDSTLTTSTGTSRGPAGEPGREPHAVRQHLKQADAALAAAQGVLTTQAAGPSDLFAAVDGAIRLANGLADLVTTVIRQAPASLAAARARARALARAPTRYSVSCWPTCAPCTGA